MSYAVKAHGKLVIDTVYEHEQLAMAHWLVNCSGDYDRHDFDYGPNRLNPAEEFKNYPEAQTVRVVIHTLELVD